MLNEDERDYDTDMSEDNGLGNALISKIGEDDTMKSLLSSFEVQPDLLSEVTSACLNVLHIYSG